MASYGYANHGYTTSNDHMDHPRYGGGYTYSDHVCKPVLIDSDGHKQPIIRYTPNESYVVKRETIVKHVRVPIDEYKNYGTTIHDDKWHRPSSPIHGRNSPHTTVEHYRYGSGSPPKYRYGSNSPPKYEVNNIDKWHRPSSPIHGRNSPHTTVEHYRYGSGSPPKYRYGSNSPPKYEVNNIDKWHTPHYDRPHQVEEFITKVQTEASQPRIVPSTDSYRHNSAKPTGHTDWSRSDPLGWTKPTGRPLSGPTSDINEAVNYLKEAVKSSSITSTGAPNSRNAELVFPKKDGYTDKIDSNEAKRRYGRPTVFKPSESYNGTISSKDAIDKYGGTFVP